MKLDRIVAPVSPRAAWAVAAFFAALWAFSLTLSIRDVYAPLAVTRFDDVEIAGTTDATGIVTARAGVRLTAPTTGPIFLSGTGSPDGVVVATTGSVYLDTSTAAIWQNDDGNNNWNRIQYATTFTDVAAGIVPASGGGTTNFLRADGTWAAPPGGGGAGSISISSAATPAAVNLSTLGTIDWIQANNAGENPAKLNNNPHKRSGGFIRTSFRWIMVGSLFSQASSTTWTVTAADNIIPNNTINSTTCYGYFNNGGGSAQGSGFAFYVPATTTTRYLRIYFTWFDSNVRITASLPDGTTQTATIGQGSGESYFLVQYSGSGNLSVVIENFTSGNNTHLKHCGISLGTA